MDDQRFDDIIKEKVGEYEDPGFDPSALTALHHHLSRVSTWPWHSRYKSELLMASGMTLCTLIIVGSQWYFSRNENDFLKHHVAVIAQKEQLESLSREITILKNLPPDTVHITEPKANQPFSSYTLLLIQRIENLEGALRKMQKELKGYQSGPLDKLANTVHSDENSYDRTDDAQNDYAYFHSKRVPVKVEERLSTHATTKEAKTVIRRERELSTETLHALEKHYQNGIGMRIGPTVEISRGLYDVGTSKTDYAGGVIGDFILSPSVSIETGAKFSRRFYRTSEENLINSHLPNVDNTLGPLLNAEVDTWILEVPLNFKYRYPINMKTNWVGSLGYSSRIYTRQSFEYEYGVDANPAARLITSTNVNKVKMYPGTLNISLGIDHELKNKKSLEISFFYQHGLGEAGVEKIKGNFFGIRSVYWFTIK